ncbi:hypothetical protein MTO96_013629 [Rhipicephalus appendiculatus]
MNQAAHVDRKLRLPGGVARAYAWSTPQNGRGRPAAARLETRTCAIPPEKNVATPVSSFLVLLHFSPSGVETVAFLFLLTLPTFLWVSQRACLRHFAVVLPDFRAPYAMQGLGARPRYEPEVEGPLASALINDRATAASTKAQSSANSRASRGVD